MIRNDIWEISLRDIKKLDFNNLFKLTKYGEEIKNIRKTIKSINVNRKLNRHSEIILKKRNENNKKRKLDKQKLLERIQKVRKIGLEAKKVFTKSIYITTYSDQEFKKKLHNLNNIERKKVISDIKSKALSIKKRKLELKGIDNRQKKIIRLNYIAEYSKLLSEISYKYNVKYEQSLSKISFLKTFWEQKDSLSKKIKKIKEDLKIKKEDYRNNYSQIKNDVKEKQKKVRNKYRLNKKSLFNSYISKNISYKAFREKRKINSKDFKRQINSIVFEENKYRKVKWVLKNEKRNYRKLLISSYKKLQIIQDDIEKNYPIEIKSWYKFVFAPLSIFVPGIMYIYLKKWKTFFINFLVYFLMIFLAMYTLGFFNVNGIGLFGLSTLGEGDAVSDSRFYVIEGTISIIFLTFILIYIFVSFRTTWYSFKVMEAGIRTKTWTDTKRFLKRDGFPYFVSLPALIMILFIVILPILATIIFSMTNYGYKHLPPGQLIQYVGIENYKKLFVNSDISLSFERVLSWTLLFTIISSVLCIIVGIGLGILTQNERLRGRKFFRFMFLLPTAIPSFITIMMIGLMFAPSGLISQWTGITTWKTEANMAKIGIIIVQVWISYSASYLMTIGVINSVPGDQKEASKIDGISKIKSFRYLVLPIILYQLLPLIVSTFMATFSNYAIIYLFTQGGPAYSTQSAGNVGQTDTIISWIFKLTESGVTPFHGLAAALLMTTTLMILPISAITLVRSKAIRKERL